MGDQVDTRTDLQTLEVVTGLALFDLDGTLTRKDTFIEFLRFHLGRWRANALLLSSLPLIVMDRMRITQDVGKRHVLRSAFVGKSLALLEEQAARFAREHMPALLRDGAMERIRWHQQQGHRVIIVTASCSLWARPWCDAIGVELIATELGIANGKFTGEMSTANCKGEEKVRRIAMVIGAIDASTTYAYGDTSSDLPMLALATNQHWKPFR